MIVPVERGQQERFGRQRLLGLDFSGRHFANVSMSFGAFMYVRMYVCMCFKVCGLVISGHSVQMIPLTGTRSRCKACRKAIQPCGCT